MKNEATEQMLQLDAEPDRVGLRAGVIELSSDDQYKVRLSGGELIDAELGPDCVPELAEQCLRARRTVLIDGRTILGALQTRPDVLVKDDDGQAVLRADELTIEAGRSMSIRVGQSTIELDADGRMRLSADRLSMDVAALIKLLSSKVELP